jgi:hypothetical protein
MTSGPDGAFVYYYILDGIAGLYTVNVYKSPYSPIIGGVPVATTTFSDCAGTLKVFKYEDINGDGKYRVVDGDKPIKDWQIWVNKTDGTPITKLITTVTGWAQVSLAYGSYKVDEEERPGWVGIENGSDPITVSFSSDVTKCVVFGNAKLGQICVFKYFDDNQNGKYEPALGDRPLGGWNFWLNGTGVNLHKVTDADGKICFSGLIPGNYKVDEEERPGWVGIENGSDPINVCLKSGMCQTVNFGNYQPPVTQKDGSISGYKYEDVNLNKAIDPGDKVVTSEWKVELYYYDAATSKWLFLGDTMTVNGFYQFTGLDISLTYKVVEVPQDGWVEVISSREGLTIPGPHGDQHNDTDFLNAKYGCISGTKWEDVNLNKAIDGADRVAPAPPDWTIELWFQDVNDGYKWKLLTSQNTDSGKYKFCGLDPYLDYKVKEVPQNDWVEVISESGILKIPVSGGVQYNKTDFLNAKYGSICGIKYEDMNLDKKIDGSDRVAPAPPDWTVDLYILNEITWQYDWLAQTKTVEGKYCFKDLDPYKQYKVKEQNQNGWVEVITEHNGLVIPVSGGVQYNKTDFLNAKYGSICGIKYEDMNLDKSVNVGDKVVAGWCVTLKMWDGDSYETIASTKTDSAGMYCFKDLDPYMKYAVYEELRDGWIEVIFKNEGLVFTSSGQVLNKGTDFLNAQVGSICGTKWEDMDLGKTINAGDVPVAGWTINLYILSGSSWKQIADVKTGADGKYCFTGLDPYAYYKVEEENPVEGWVSVITIHENVKIKTSGGRVCNVDFLNAERGCICGHKYWDKDYDGVYDICLDVPLQGWTIKLYVLETGAWVFKSEKLTDVCGLYCFCDLDPYKTYMVKEVVQCNWEAINPKDGSIDPIIFKASGQHITDQDFFNARGSGPTGLTMEFWKTNVGKDLYYIYGTPQVTASSMERYLRAIYTKYYVGMGYNFAYLKFDPTLTQKQVLQKAWAILNIPDSASMQQKAEAQSLALLLTEQYKSVFYSKAQVYIPSSITGHGPFQGLMSDAIVNILKHYKMAQYAPAKNEAEFLNKL